jgi:predicted small secreted protein
MPGMTWFEFTSTHRGEDTQMRIIRLVGPAAVLLLASSLAGCGDTWQGVKKDTGENLEATGQAIERAGEKIKD